MIDYVASNGQLMDKDGKRMEIVDKAARESAAANAARISELSEEKVDKENSKVVKIVLTDKDIVNDKLINESGQEVNTLAWDCTMPISLPFDDESKISVRCTLNGGGSLAFYTEDGEVLKYISGNNASDYGIVPSGNMQVVDVILPPNAAYIRMSAQKGSDLNYKHHYDFWLEGTVTGNVVEEMERLREDVNFALDVLDVKEETLAVEYSDVVIDNAFINGYGLPAIGAEGYKCTNYINLPAKKGSKATLRSTIIGYCGFAFYDKNTMPLLVINGDNASEYGISPGSNMQTVSVTVPDGTRYVRLSASREGYTAPSDFFVSATVETSLRTDVQEIDDELMAIGTDVPNYKVLVIGDSISADYYGNYTKWVTFLTDVGFLNKSKTVNDSVHATGFVTRYNNEANDFITRIESVANPETYDLVVVFGGINDYIQNIPMGESGGDKTANFKPAVDYFFATLTETFVGARIAVLTPLRTSNYNNANTAGHKQSDYADYIKTVANSYALPVLDLTDHSGFHPEHDAFRQRWTFKDWTGGDGTQGDGTHPIEEYERKYLAPMIRHFLQGLL